MASEKVAVMVTVSLALTILSASVSVSTTVGGVVSVKVLEIVKVMLSAPL